MSVRVRLSTPAGRASALAAIDIFAHSAGELEPFIRKHAGVRTKPGDMKLAHLAGVDHGLVIHWTDTFAQLTPHGGVAVVDELIKVLGSAGAEIVADVDPIEAYPEARSDVDARSLAALSHAVSPMAVDLLLAQHERWEKGDRKPTDVRTDRDVRLMRLIGPALVAVVGEPNVGKSTLLNTLAGRELAIVSDEAGTTRDHVGALINLGGLVVRWVDTPGVRDATGPEAQAIGLAQRLIADADLVIAVGDMTTGDPREVAGVEPGMVVALRADLGKPDWQHDLAVSAATGDGMPELVSLVRDRLVPMADLEDPGPWKFWE
ncbi:MAG: 50S ribosome-binding GTPase [Phycisphaerales bacterium]|nr:50S ribosome-binding GTPase [Phycisphaerales bacterium]MCB9836899.1 50S ribosome-binding GTPase [Phycisphaera sp.]